MPPSSGSLDFSPDDKWLLKGALEPDKSNANAFIVAKEGPLPVGANTWVCWFDQRWLERTLTVTLQ